MKTVTLTITVGFVTCTLAVMASSQNARAPVQTVVLSGQSAPGSNGASFVGFNRPSINNRGAVVFRAELTHQDVPYGAIPGKLIPVGIFIGGANTNVARVVGYGDAVPNESETFTDFGDPVINDSGQIAFMAGVGAGFENHGVFLKQPVQLITITRTGRAAPGTDGTFTHLGLLGVSINNAGSIAFEARYSGSISGDGIFVYSNGDLKPLVLQGQPVPGTQSDSFESFQSLATNQRGQIAFVASVNSGLGSKTGVFVAEGGKITPLAREGQVVSGEALHHLSAPSIDESGAVVFVDSLAYQARGTAAYVPKGIFTTSATSSISMIVNASRLANSSNFARPVNARASDGTSAVLFLASQPDTGKRTVWQYAHDTLVSVVQDGDSAAGGATYTRLSFLSIAPSGYFAFASGLQGSSAKSGLFTSRTNF
jgi:hypothetical protein